MSGAEQHVRLERQDNAIGLVAQNEDWTRDAGHPVGAARGACLLVPVSQEVLGCYWRFDAADPAHLDRQDFSSIARPQRVERGARQRFVIILVLGSRRAVTSRAISRTRRSG